MIVHSQRRRKRSNRIMGEEETLTIHTIPQSRRAGGNRKKSTHNLLHEDPLILPDPDEIEDLVFDEEILMGVGEDVELDEYDDGGESSDDNVGSSSNSTTSSTNYGNGNRPSRGSFGKTGGNGGTESAATNYNSSGEKSGGSMTGHSSQSAGSHESRKRKSASSARERNMRRLESNERERQRMHSLNDAFQVS